MGRERPDRFEGAPGALPDDGRCVRGARVDERALPAERFEAKGFGPDKAVADNRTKKGQEANRRVEFHITEREAAKSPNQDQPTEKPELK